MHPPTLTPPCTAGDIHRQWITGRDMGTYYMDHSYIALYTYLLTYYHNSGRGSEIMKNNRLHTNLESQGSKGELFILSERQRKVQIFITLLLSLQERT